MTVLSRHCGVPLDIARIFWTPPLTPKAAWQVERTAVLANFERALVSLTDHDNIDGALELHDRYVPDAPVSVEWTVPWGLTFFHLGIHNMDRTRARDWMKVLAAYTADTQADNPVPILAELGQDPGLLIVFNHPLWDENGIGRDLHVELATEFLVCCSRYIHALEFNGLRSFAENLDVVRMGRQLGVPVVSGGDRHGTKSNAVLNVSNAATFPEFADEVRRGYSTVLITDEYYRPVWVRLARDTLTVLEPRESPEEGQTTWHDRVLYACEEGVMRRLSDIVPASRLRDCRLTSLMFRLLNPTLSTACRLAGLRMFQPERI